MMYSYRVYRSTGLGWVEVDSGELSLIILVTGAESVPSIKLKYLSLTHIVTQSIREEIILDEILENLGLDDIRDSFITLHCFRELRSTRIFLLVAVR